jgi:hypothetical protein
MRICGRSRGTPIPPTGCFEDSWSSEHIEEIRAIADLSKELPNAGRLPETLLASFWDRQASAALRDERRDAALLATLESLVLSTPLRRQRAASLISDDYPLLLASLPPLQGVTTVFDPVSMLLTSADGARMSQWSYSAQDLQQREAWSVTALEVLPLVRRVIDRTDTECQSCTAV